MVALANTEARMGLDARPFNLDMCSRRERDERFTLAHTAALVYQYAVW